ncbi:MAG: alpha/beta hydrolase [Lentisphaerae bacterium]|jgi:acetyl esterase/lipase|nr:alpha/beta hydrolase [Lentisphaerota bacterium]
MTEHLRVLLWPDGAPGALGDSPADCPDLTVTFPALRPSGPWSCVVVCPGGGYSCKAAHEATPIALWLNSLGLAAAVVQYRVSPYRYPIPANDVRRAIRLIRANAKAWNINPEQIGVLGFSAGGHCAMTAATVFDAGRADDPDPVDRQSSRPDALIACYPVVTLSSKRHHGSMLNLLADAQGQVDPNLQQYLSLENRVTPETPPTFLWHTADDQAVPVENSLYFATALRQHQVPFELHVFPHGRHGLALANDDPVVGQWKELCRKWLQGLGFTII